MKNKGDEFIYEKLDLKYTYILLSEKPLRGSTNACAQQILFIYMYIYIYEKY